MRNILLTAIVFNLFTTSAYAVDLSKMEASQLGTRLINVRVCRDIASLFGIQTMLARNLFNKYDKHATLYLSKLRYGDKRNKEIIKAMEKTAFQRMSSTGIDNWKNICLPIFNSKNNDYL